MPLQTNINLLDEVMKTRPGAQPASEASSMQAMQAVQQPGANVQQIGAALASSAGQENLKQTQQVIAETAPKMDSELSADQRAAKQEASVKELSYRRLAEKNTAKVASLGLEVSRVVNEDARKFKTDEAGRKYMNQNMLDNYAVEKMQSDQQLQDYLSTTQLLYERKATLMDTYGRQLDQVLNQGYLREKGDLDQKSAETITKLRAQYRLDAEKAMKKARARSSTGALITGVFTVAGTIVGAVGSAYFTGGTATAAGATAGGAAGGAIGQIMGQQVDKAQGGY